MNEEWIKKIIERKREAERNVICALLMDGEVEENIVDMRLKDEDPFNHGLATPGDLRLRDIYVALLNMRGDKIRVDPVAFVDKYKESLGVTMEEIMDIFKKSTIQKSSDVVIDLMILDSDILEV